MKSWDIAYRNLAPGKVLDLLLLEYSIACGYKKLDLGRGNESYKYDYLAQNVYLEHSIFSRKSIKGFILLEIFTACEYCKCVLSRRVKRLCCRWNSFLENS
jgi:CelD/BcsL family acetyltransferase involved in cellulose biosynthesis